MELVSNEVRAVGPHTVADLGTIRVDTKRTKHSWSYDAAPVCRVEWAAVPRFRELAEALFRGIHEYSHTGVEHDEAILGLIEGSILMLNILWRLSGTLIDLSM
jgi:hypothetical protein